MTIEWNKGGLRYQGRKISPKRLSLRAHDRIKLGRGILLKDIVKVIKSDLDTWDLLIQLNALKDLIKEFGSMRSKIKQSVNQLVLEWVPEVYIDSGGWKPSIFDELTNKKKIRKEYYKKSHDFSIYLAMSGKKRGHKDNYCMSFVGAKEMANTEVVMNPKVNLFISENTKHRKMYLGEMYPTVLELFRSIFYDLTFYGNPKQRDAALKEIDKRAKESREA